jgi:hypothetical protein
VVLPLLKPALVAALVYSFVRAITTVSAVIFLVTAENELATTYIIGRVGNGDYGVALAYCTVLIILMSLATALIQLWWANASWAGEENCSPPKRLQRAPPSRGHSQAGSALSLNTQGMHHVRHRFRNVTKRYGTDPSAPLAVRASASRCRAAR